MHPTARDAAPAAVRQPHGDVDGPITQDTDMQDTQIVAWHTIGLETESMLVVSLRRRGSHCFAAQCQWPRIQSLSVRTVTVTHHPLIMVECTRQLVMALEREYRHAVGAAPLEPVSMSLGLHPWARPAESGSATDVAVRIRVSDLVTWAGMLVAYRVTAEYLNAGVPFASCTMRLAPAAYTDTACDDKLVRPALLYPWPAAVGAASEPDVPVARAPQGRLVVAPRDPGHLVLLPGHPSRLPTPARTRGKRRC